MDAEMYYSMFGRYVFFCWVLHPMGVGKGGAVVGKLFTEISATLREFIEKQPMFFVATAPLSADGHVNMSPKGYDSFRMLGPNEVCYLDLTGSGNETSAHLLENGRITFMFCAFSGAPQILRLYGQGTTVLPGSERWEELAALFSDYAGARQIIVSSIDLVQTSCGFGVPRMEMKEQRDTLVRWAEHKGEDELEAYREAKNSESLDGLVSPLGARG